jgi:glutathione peroxidase
MSLRPTLSVHAKFFSLPLPSMLAPLSAEEGSRRMRQNILRMRVAVRRGLACVLVLGVLSAIGGAPAPAERAKVLAYNFSFEAIEGGRMPLEQWRGKVLLVVNTASFCGYTPQYEGLQALWQRYSERGLVVIGVPSNDFGGQEPNSEQEILGFCKGAYNVSFPLTSKQEVSGARAHPFYHWALDSLGAGAAPKWNFHKYLVGRDGNLVSAFPTRVAPQAPELIRAIEAALAKA